MIVKKKRLSVQTLTRNSQFLIRNYSAILAEIQATLARVWGENDAELFGEDA